MNGRVGHAALVGAVAAALVACDTRQNFEVPEWTLSRMLEQPRYSPYGESSFFADGNAMRPPVEGTVARDTVIGPEPLVRGTLKGQDVTAIPLPVTLDLVLEGERRFDIVCATCHGIRGDGESVVATKMQLRPPPSLLGADIAAFAPGRLFRVITDGYGLMMPMSTILDVRERWAVVAYVQALELSQSMPVASLPDDMRAELAREAP
jgi:mono/diheme cytochrome c family protein